MQSVQQKAVSYQEAAEAYRTLGWRLDYLQAWGVTGAQFAHEIAGACLRQSRVGTPF